MGLKITSKGNQRRLVLLFDLDSLRHALFGGLPNQVMVLLRDFVKFDNGQQLVFVVLENLRTNLLQLRSPMQLLFSLLLAAADRLLLP
jgi:hypothetical protein